MVNSREEYAHLAKLAEPAEQYEEMVEFMKKVSNSFSDYELTVEERSLLFTAYKNVIGTRRASWCIISLIEQKEESHSNKDHVATIRDYRGKIEGELSKIVNRILNLLGKLVSLASSKRFEELKTKARLRENSDSN